MTRIHDFHFFEGGYVIVTLMGISRCPRSKESIGGCRNIRGGRKRRAERDIVIGARSKAYNRRVL